MFSKKIHKRGRVLRKRGFTLIEMLIVIVIIGILAAALIPRLLNARGRANDTARKADLQQIATVLVAYQIDHGTFPLCTNGCNLSFISSGLVEAGMNGLPLDPNASRTFAGLGSLTTTAPGQFGYITVTKGGIPNNGFILMAGSETEGGSNYVYAGTAITTNTPPFESINLCTSFITTSCTPGANNNGVCCYNKNADQLRYIFMY